ncbi:STAS domain-containing protein [Methylophilus luteus]|uniref:Lipid asymmetry maintenance protein MlaB n=1 Tax=Methylophilus luteus TaxID=640108 RepID=A0ABW3F5G3_9PROT
MATITHQDNILSFSGDLLFNNISNVLDQLQTMRLDPPLTLDFSKVEEVDTVAVSLVFEIQRQFHHDHAQAGSISVVGVPDNLRSLMQLYGVDSFLLN